MPMKPQSAKSKGRNLQQWVRDKILQVFKGLTLDDVRSTSMGAGGEDILLSPKARNKFPFSVECKANKAFSVYKYYEQCKANCPKGAEPLVIIKGNHKKPLALIDAEYFIKLCSKL